LNTRTPTTLLGTTHTHTRKRMYKYTHTHAHTLTHACIRTHIILARNTAQGRGVGQENAHDTSWHITYTHKRMHANTYIHTHIILARKAAQVEVGRARGQARGTHKTLVGLTHSYTHTHIHTHTQIHTHTHNTSL
jgi:hypothetical protein